ncbi:MAG: serine/threonine protein kinase [Candidatus Obscuribacterales bacterium]|nr:serine/threonine protein kinase [Candidatus Obscuribacterales bacterium]
MAELNITLKYKYAPARALFILMIATLPIWEVAAPIAVGYIIGLVIRQANSLPYSVVATAIPGLLLLIAACIALTACAEDNRLHLSKDGLSLPLFFLPKLKFRRARQWSELLSADLHVLSDGRSFLYLSFQESVRLQLDLSCFQKSEIEQLLLAIELWATNCKRSQELVDYQNRLQNESQGISQEQGYTQMWEEELSRRFQATSFVPLEPKQSLQKGKLEVVRQLAFGGLSAIYLAQENQAELVVLKEAVVPAKADAETKAEAEKHLLREAELLSKFKHPGAAKVLDHFVENGRHYLKLEYINGTDLRQYVKQNGLVEAGQAVDWGLEILEVLAAMHTQDPPIIHRDLTPENIVLCKDSLKVIDFGAANEFVGSATGTIVGKQSYMPAEQLRGKSVIASDLYAFAGTMHFLLTGKDPLPLSSARPKDHNPTIDERLDAIIARCSEFEPEDRYQSAEELIEELKSWRNGVRLKTSVAAENLA